MDLIECEDWSQAIEKEKLEESSEEKIDTDWQDVMDLQESSLANKRENTDESIEFESFWENDLMKLEDTLPTGKTILLNETLSTSENIELKAKIRKMKEAMEDMKRERSEVEENFRKLISKSERRDKIRTVLLRGRINNIETLQSEVQALQNKGIF